MKIKKLSLSVQIRPRCIAFKLGIISCIMKHFHIFFMVVYIKYQQFKGFFGGKIPFFKQSLVPQLKRMMEFEYKK